jgi:hypothetical protein
VLLPGLHADGELDQVDLLAREQGRAACVNLARGPHPDGPVRALEVAFPRALRHTERAWRSHLKRLADQ